MEFNSYFKDEVFDYIYYSQFEWFREELGHTDKVLSLGCGSGRETFALMWELKAVEAKGIDVDCKKIKRAKQCTQDILEFAKIMQQALVETDNEQFQTWYENMPTELVDGIAPKFFQGDISDNLLESISRPESYFDLVYCRNVLYFIADKGRDKLHLTLQNIAQAVKPEAGRVVAVEPTTKDDTQYNFEICFEQAGLILTKEPEHKSRLGYLKMPETNPKGYIMKQKAPPNHRLTGP
jgi:chemotaxis methyl-accepting protein methylase